MDNIIRLDPDVVIAPSPTPFETTNRINTIKLRIYIYIYIYITLTFRAPTDATDLHTSFLRFFSLSSSTSSHRPRRPSFIRLRAGIRCTRGEGGANTCIHVERQVGGEQLRSNLVHLPGNELSRHVVYVMIKHHSCGTRTMY